MSILIKGIEMPKEPDEMIELAIFGDGKTVKTGESWRSPVDGKCYYGTSEDMNTYSALTVPAHGRLIDADGKAFPTPHRNPSNDYMKGWNACLRSVQQQPIVIPAEGGE